MYKAFARENRRRKSSITAAISMGFLKKRSVALQGTLWSLLRLAQAIAQNHSNASSASTNRKVPEKDILPRQEREMDDGSIALLIICLILIFLTICAISFHYCNFKANEKYEKLERENELVEVDLYESDS